MVMRTLNADDHARVSAAITAAETHSDGEIVAIAGLAHVASRAASHAPKSAQP